MEYISAKQAAEKWGVSLRFVQRRCTEGRIEGAAKLGNAWIIPQNAEKPKDMRKLEEKPESIVEATPLPGEMREIRAFPLMNAFFQPGRCNEYIETIKNKDERCIARAEYCYYTGNTKKCSDIAEAYLESDDVGLKYSALWLFAFSNLALERPGNVRKALRIIKKLCLNLENDADINERAIAVCLYNSVYARFHVLKPEDIPQAQDYVYMLPKGFRLFVAFNQAYYAYTRSLYGVAVGIAETGLVLDEKKCPVPTIYLHLACAMGYIHMGYINLAQKHIADAWEYAKGDGFIEPFGEFHGPLCGLIESMFKKTAPEDFRKMIKVAKRYSVGWIKIHNELTGDVIPSDLTPTEYVVCMLVARGWVTKEIASHLAVTANAVHKCISDAMGKMGISKRSDIKKIMLSI